MTSNTEQRRLAAIMSTDMVGYSALAQRDEALALALLEEHNRILRDVFARHQGTEVKTTGDGFLLEFPSALAAVQCAVEIQRGLAVRNAAYPAEQRIQIRIGIHLGDVVRKDGDIAGDGVNIAARIEPLAEPGGICISNSVYDQIENKVAHPLVPLAKPELKNIQASVEVYKLVLDGDAKAIVNRRNLATASLLRWPRIALASILVAAIIVSAALYLKSGSDRSARDGARALRPNALPEGTAIVPADQKSVAVLPFVNMSSDKENEYLSDGITEELLNALARVPGLHVPARTSSFSFKGKNEDVRKIGDLLRVGTVLEGSVRKSGNRLRISAQLINAADGYHLWSETYDRELKNVFAIEDEITRTIVDKLRITLTGSAIAQPRHPENIEAWELYLKGRFHVYRYTEKDLTQAITFFQQALTKQPNNAFAYAGLSMAYSGLHFFGYANPTEMRPLIKNNAVKALSLNGTLADAQSQLAWAAVFEWDWESAERGLKRAVELDPVSVDAHYIYAELLYNLGRFKEALIQNEIARRLDPLNSSVIMQAGYILSFSRQYDRDLGFYEQAKAIDPKNWFVHDTIGDVMFRRGQTATAIAEAETAVRLDRGSRQLARLGRMYAQVGRTADAKRILNKLFERKKKRFVYAYCMAWVYEGLRDFEQANVWMSKAIDDHEAEIIDLRTEADDLRRSNPHYPEWLKKIGLEK